ncbi:MAG TPA: methyl-accepting chemotaxis protein [Rhodocyclaceae bacterium]|nr:methyl-accepting chemotaxis protein [Rhodocyclaceae bacterium]
MTIYQRLMLLVGSAIAGMLFLAGVGFYQMGRVYEAANFGNVNVVPSLEVLNKAMLEFGHIRVRIYRHVLNSEQSVMKELDEKIKESRAGVEKAFKDYDPALIADAKDKAGLEADKAAYAEYIKGVDHILELSRAERKDEARDLLTKYAAQAEKLNDAFVAHMQYNDDLGEKTAVEGAATKSFATVMSAVVCLVGIGVLVAIGTFTVRTMNAKLEEANSVANRVASGDLTAHPVSDSGDEIGLLIRSLEKMRVELSKTIRDVVGEANEVATSATHLSTAAQQVTTSTQSQASSTSSAAAAVEELTVSIDHVGSSAEDASARAAEAGSLAVTSAQGVESASVQISQVAERVEHTAAQMQVLSEQVQQIGNITTVIREVADQTNLLALNAAIEAARAGEQGRGFAVVADEVRKLAERTTSSVQEISSVIGNIQEGAVAAVESMQSSREVVTQVVHAAQEASASMSSIRSAAETVEGAITNISYALREQRATSTELARNVESIAQMSEENSAAVASVADTANRLVSVSDSLKGSVSRFRV